ncbi:putative gcn5-related n-acetyltransferase [Dichotomopilus funicola]|uniref:Gcn5-related n-acetyltransferase n=1 Tax=Dichotomopilus funicola TaxID=1934379 RepID=A0AAN6UYN2_9PEZI|nr:putative gcn5-related n-acetyltransferase [Dichotomopilus funicola]
MASWRRMTIEDVPDLLRVADQVHPGLPESGNVFGERVKLFPEGCLILANQDKVYGYAISHPIRQRQPPALDTLLGGIAPDADQLLEVAGRYPTACLVSVYGTAPFWSRFGFEPEQVDLALLEKLRNYGDDAVYLSRRSG